MTTLLDFFKVKPKNYTIELPQGQSWCKVIPVLPPELQMDSETFERIWSLHPVELPQGIVGDKEVTFRRWVLMFGEDYVFSGQRHTGLPVEDPHLKKILKWVQEDSGQPYQSLLINFYQDGSHYIGKHRDSRENLVPGSSIYSFSYGQDRDFVIESDDSPRTYRKVIKLEDGSGLIMGGEMQRYYKHSVPIRVQSKCPGRRINITARLFDQRCN